MKRTVVNLPNGIRIIIDGSSDKRNVDMFRRAFERMQREERDV